MVHTKALPGMEDLTKAEVGEIDTRPPFQSVKDAVNLFGDRVSLSGGKTATKKEKAVSAEKPFTKETEFHLAQKEMNRLKEQVQIAENTKAEALVELETAKNTVDDLSRKLKLLTESKEGAIQATEAALKQTKQFEEGNNGKNLRVDNVGDPEGSRQEYSNVLSDLNVLKQELAKIRRDFNTSLEEKTAAMKQVEEAEISARDKKEKASELSNTISTVKGTMEQVKEISLKREQGVTIVENDVERVSYKARLEESAKKLEMMRKDFDPQVSENLEMQLADVMSDIEALRKELDDNALKVLVDYLKSELEGLRREHAGLKEKEVETESIIGNLHVKLRKCKSELEVALAEEAKATGASEQMTLLLNKLASEAENARHELEETRVKSEELKKEAEATRVSLEEVEEQLTIALREAEEAKSSEARAIDKVKVMTEKNDVSRSVTSSELGSKITISRDEYENLNRKVEESEKLAEMKVAAALAQLEAVKVTRKEIEDMKASTEEALNKAKIAEEAKNALERELGRLRDKEQKKETEIASRVLEEHNRVTKSGTVDYKVHHIEEDAGEKPITAKKLEKQRSSFSRKMVLPRVSGIFTKKKSQVERGSPSDKK